MRKGNQWADHYARRAKEEKWLARSVYKLEEIDRRFKLIRQNHRLLDLGCYPGSWSQYSIKKVGARGEVVGVDLKKPNRFSAPNFRFIRADVLRLDPVWLANQIGPRDVVISDLAPQTTGIRTTDAIRSLELAGKALAISLVILGHKGDFLCKVLEGEGFKAFKDQLQGHFSDIRIARPSAVRKASKEVFLLGLRFKRL